MDRILLGAILSLFSPILLATPVLPPSPQKPKIPKVTMESNWGVVTQNDKRVFISGHEHWSAEGHFREDGKVYILWTENSNGREAPGLYEVKIDSKTKRVFLQGHWGYGDEVILFPDKGPITGNFREDSIFEHK